MSTFATSKQTRKDIQSGAWASDHGLFHDLLPYGYRKTSAIDVLKAFRETYETLGEYKQLFRMADVREITGVTISPNQHRELLYFAGTWDVKGHGTTNPVYYANPKYTHKEYPPVDESHRERIIRATFEIPYWHGKRLSWAFGLSPSQSIRYRKRYCGKLESQRHNMKKWARTVKAMNKWGHTYAELSEVLPYSKRALEGQVQRNASNFRVPSNPLDHNL